MKFHKRVVPGSSGALLHCFHTVVDDKKQSILIALPFGVPATVAGAAFARFEREFNVLTWETRFILNLEQPFSGREEMAPLEHVEDMICILKALSIDACILIGYCSGAGISLLGATRYPRTFAELILVSGEYQLFRRGHASTAYQRSIDSFLPIVAGSRQNAGYMFSTMAEISKASKADPKSELEQQINLPFSKEEYLFRYSKNYMAYRDFDALALAREVPQPTIVLAGRLDEHSSMENSEAVRNSIPGSTAFIDGKADHYGFCRPGSLMLEAISAHLSKHI